jgi:hypothetical protein
MFNDAEIKFLSSTKEIVGTDTIQYGVETVSLNDLLEQYNAPEHINYLSVDTKGGELQILETLDFNKYKPWLPLHPPRDPPLKVRSNIYQRAGDKICAARSLHIRISRAMNQWSTSI